MPIIKQMKWIVLFSFFVAKIFSHDERYDSIRKAKFPEEIFSSERYRNLDSTTRETNIQEKISNYEQALSEYYSQFIEEKRIEEERQRAGEFTDKKNNFNVNLFFRTHSGKVSTSSNVNAIRLYSAQEQSIFGPSYLIRDSETLYRTHFNLAKLYREVGEKHKAMEHFLACFRYRNFSPTEENFERENGLREMLNVEHKNKLQTHAKVRKELEDLKQKVRQEEDEIHALEAEALRNSIVSRTTFNFNSREYKVKLEAKKQELENKQKEYEKSKQENFLPVVIQRGEENANALLELANLVRELEADEKVKQNIKQAYPVSYNKLTNFPSYVSILEFSHRLSPENPEIIKKIAEEYKSVGKKKEALGFYLKYESLPKERFLNPKEDVSLMLGMLYSDLGQFVLAAPYYELHFQNLNLEQKFNFAYFLGEFFLKKLGNFEKSHEYFQKFLESPKDSTQPSTLKKLTIAYFGISKYYKNIQQSDKEEKNLQEAYKNMTQLKQLLEKNTQELNQKKEELLKLKQGLLYATESGELEMYREEEKKLALEIEKLSEIKNLYHSLPKYELLIRLAKVYESQNDYKKAKAYLREIIDFGTEVEVSSVLKNIQRLEKIEKDGIFRAWIP